MSTDDLIRALANDAPTGRRAPLYLQVAAAVTIGFGIAFALFTMVLGPRPDIAAVAQDMRFLFKFVVTLALAASAAGLVLRLVRPAAATGGWAIALWIGPALLALGAAYELLSMPAAQWQPRMIGRNSILCLASIPLLAAPVLAALMIVLKRGAPEQPGFAGAVAGLVAGGLGAALYAAHCVDDSPLFVMAWYGPAIVMVAFIGAAVGRRVLRW